MARYYQTPPSPAVFIDYLPKDDFGTGGRKKRITSSSEFLGDFQALPEDRTRLMEILQDYDEKANKLTQEMVSNPNNSSEFKIKAENLAREINNNVKAGELAAIKDRLNQYQTRVKYYQENLKDDPLSMQNAIKQIVVPPLGYDPRNSSYGKIDGYNVVKPFTVDDQQKLISTLEKSVKDKVLSKVDDVKKLDKYTSVWQAGEDLGVTEQDVYRSFVGTVTPDMIRSEQQKYDLAGIPANEQNFYTKDTQGNLKPNLNTSFGRLMYSMGEQLRRSKQNIKNTNIKDEAGLIRLRSAEQRRNIKYKKDLDDPDVSWMVDKVVSLYKGDEDAYETKESTNKGGSIRENIKKDNFLKGFKTEDGAVITGTAKRAGDKPYVTIEKKVTKVVGNVKTESTEKEEVPLDLDLIESLDINDAPKQALIEEFRNRGILRDNREINVDYTIDLETGVTPAGAAAAAQAGEKSKRTKPKKAPKSVKEWWAQQQQN